MAKIYLLGSQKYEGVENLEVFQIEYISSEIDLSKYDALIFTSKNGIYSINSFNNQWKDIPSYSISTKTANIVEKLKGNNIFDAKATNGDEFAKKLINKLKNKKVLYIKALKVVSNLTTILKEAKIDIDELIAYKTVCKKQLNKTIESNSTIIFTSPSSIECFFKNYQWDKSFNAIVIGKTTAKYLPKNIDYKISPDVNIQECINLAKQLYI
ncbi:MAG: uroporphyrinogen-III synthase [Halarcobacter sp.]